MKTINIVNKIVATNLNIDLKTVEKVNKLYWKEIVKNLTQLSEEAVHIKKIGTITASPFKTNNHIRMMLNRIRKLKRSVKYTDQTRDRLVEEAKESLRKLLKKRNQFTTRNYNEQINRISEVNPRRYRKQGSYT